MIKMRRVIGPRRDKLSPPISSFLFTVSGGNHSSLNQDDFQKYFENGETNFGHSGRFLQDLGPGSVKMGFSMRFFIRGGSIFIDFR